MISHKVREEVIRLGSLVVYFLWESPHVDVPIVQNFYWHDKTCTKSVGPFFSVTAAMQDYADAKRAQKALQRRGLVQELQPGRAVGKHPALGAPYGRKRNERQ